MTMETHPNGRRPWYRSEPWLAAAAAAFVPVLLALVLPEALKTALAALAGAFLLLSFWLLIRRGAPRREE